MLKKILWVASLVVFFDAAACAHKPITLAIFNHTSCSLKYADNASSIPAGGYAQVVITDSNRYDIACTNWDASSYVAAFLRVVTAYNLPSGFTARLDYATNNNPVKQTTLPIVSGTSVDIPPADQFANPDAAIVGITIENPGFKVKKIKYP